MAELIRALLQQRRTEPELLQFPLWTSKIFVHLKIFFKQDCFQLWRSVFELCQKHGDTGRDYHVGQIEQSP